MTTTPTDDAGAMPERILAWTPYRHAAMGRWNLETNRKNAVGYVREDLAQPGAGADEPVAWAIYDHCGKLFRTTDVKGEAEGCADDIAGSFEPLYARPATIQPYTARERVLAEALDDMANCMPRGACERIDDHYPAITLAAEITSSPTPIQHMQSGEDYPCLTLESLLAKVPEETWLKFFPADGPEDIWVCRLETAKFKKERGTGATAALALSAALEKLNTQGEKP